MTDAMRLLMLAAIHSRLQDEHIALLEEHIAHQKQTAGWLKDLAQALSSLNNCSRHYERLWGEITALCTLIDRETPMGSPLRAAAQAIRAERCACCGKPERCSREYGLPEPPTSEPEEGTTSA